MACVHVAIDPGMVAFTSAHPPHAVKVAHGSPPSVAAPASVGFTPPLSFTGKHDAEQLDIAQP
jgi:hypothetical protein